jgi:flagellar protein FliO/FliZ
VAGTGAPSAAAPASGTAQAPAVQPDTTAAPADTAVPAPPAAPDVVAPRPAAPSATVPPVTMPAGSSTGSLLQTLFALIVVLAVLGALAWFLKRYGPKVAGGNANLRVVGSLNLGGRERIVVVEVGNEWIVVGASPGRINALATMPRQEGQHGDTGSANATLAPHAPAAHSFADWLKQTIDKRK